MSKMVFWEDDIVVPSVINDWVAVFSLGLYLLSGEGGERAIGQSPMVTEMVTAVSFGSTIL